MKDSLDKPYFVFGIRHHGAGSAYFLSKALEEYLPDCILIECPEDTQKLIDSTNFNNIKLPAAILMYKDGQPDSSKIIPFAAFSPEWVAMKYASDHSIVVRAIDLPLGLYIKDKSLPFERLVQPSEDKSLNDTGSAFQFLSQLQGIDDPELWWEVNFESSTNQLAHFQKINDLMNGILPSIEKGSQIDSKTREAWMRKNIRKAIKEGFQRIAVVCGAAHQPFLDDLNHFKSSADNTLCKNTIGKHMVSSWIPWSYKKLSSYYGYSAGVPYPKYYEHLFTYRESAPMTLVSDLSVSLRKKGFEVSPAHTIETVHLATVLANLRGHDIAGIDIIRESARAVYNLEDSNFNTGLIDEAFIGDQTGEVPVDIINQALITDFYNQVKQFRFNKYLKQTTPFEVTLDLRQSNMHQASRFLWQLRLLDITWGEPTNPFKNTKGTFNEYWILEWSDEYLIHLFHQTMFGSTITAAAREKTKDKLIQNTSPENLLLYFRSVINADIPELSLYLIGILDGIIYDETKTSGWLDFLVELIACHKYGSVRQLDIDKIGQLINDLIVKILIHLPSLSISFTEEETNTYFKQLRNVHETLRVSELENTTTLWIDTLEEMSDNYLIPAKIRGWITALCLESGRIQTHEVLESMAFQLSDLDNLEKSVAWLEGLLSIQVFSEFEIPQIIAIINMWLSHIHADKFKQIVPGLRKAFAKLTPGFKKSIISFTRGRHANKMFEISTTIDQNYLDILQKYLHWIGNQKFNVEKG